MLTLFDVGLFAGATSFQVILRQVGQEASVGPVERVEVLVGRLMGVKELYYIGTLVN